MDGARGDTIHFIKQSYIQTQIDRCPVSVSVSSVCLCLPLSASVCLCLSLSVSVCLSSFLFRFCCSSASLSLKLSLFTSCDPLSHSPLLSLHCLSSSVLCLSCSKHWLGLTLSIESDASTHSGEGWYTKAFTPSSLTPRV